MRLLMATLVLAAATTVLGQEVGDTLIVTGDKGVDLRLKKETVATAPKGTKLTVERIDGEWLWVPFGGKTGWVWSKAGLAFDLGFEEIKPRAQDRQISLVVESLLTKQHLLKPVIDDERARRTLTLFLDQLDQQKRYFYRCDVDEFFGEVRQLDDEVKRGNVQLAFTIFNRLLYRTDQRVELVERILAEPMDLTGDDEMIVDRGELGYPAGPDEAKDAWRKYVKYELLRMKVAGTTLDEGRDKLRRRFQYYRSRLHQSVADEVLEMFLSALTQSVDPHCKYMSPASWQNFQIMMRQNLEGIGASLQTEDGYVKVTKIIPGGAADKHGRLKPGDKIVAVGQGPGGELVDAVGKKLADVVNLIRGPAGSTVHLKVIAESGSAPQAYAIQRSKIDLSDQEVRSEIMEAGRKPNGVALRAGVIDLSSFYMDMKAAQAGKQDYVSVTRDLREVLKNFTRQSVDAVVLDLRRNGGGSLAEAINVTGLFLDSGPVMQVKDSAGSVQHYDDLDEGLAWSGPLVVLTSKLSAGAGEILAAAVQDYQRGIVVGDSSTHGMGTVGSPLDLGQQLFGNENAPKLGVLKLTMQQFYRVNGDSTQLRGVLPDISLPSLTAHMDLGESSMKHAVPFDRVPAVKYETLDGFVSPALLAQLRAASVDRREQSEDWGRVRDQIRIYRERKKVKRVSLNEKTFRARAAELEAVESATSTDEDYYLDEVLAIVRDYVSALAGR